MSKGCSRPAIHHVCPSVRPHHPLVSSHFVSSRLDTSRHVTPTPTASARLGEQARARGMPIFFIQLHIRCTGRLPHKLDGRLLKYLYDISLFSLALNKWALILSFIIINGSRSIYSNNPHQKFYATLEMLSSSLLFWIYQYHDGDC
jgi:hypothetical protein